MIWTAIALFSCVTAATASSAMFPPSTADAPPGPGIPLTLAEDRARRVSNLRYDLKLTIPQSQSDRLRGTIIVRFALSDASRALSLDFAPADGVTATRVAGSAVTLQRVPDHVIVPPEHLRNGRQRDRAGFRCRRRVTEPEPGIPLFALRSCPRPSGDSVLRSTGPEGTMDARARHSERLAGGQQRRRGRTKRGFRTSPAAICGDATAANVSVRVRSWTIPGRDG